MTSGEVLWYVGIFVFLVGPGVYGLAKAVQRRRMSGRLEQCGLYSVETTGGKFGIAYVEADLGNMVLACILPRTYRTRPTAKDVTPRFLAVQSGLELESARLKRSTFGNMGPRHIGTVPFATPGFPFAVPMPVNGD